MGATRVQQAAACAVLLLVVAMGRWLASPGSLDHIDKGPKMMAPGAACLVSPLAACEACKKASSGECKPRYAWNWTAPPTANDLAASLSGLRAIRGIDALSEPGISVVARWRENNWPALQRAGRAKVYTSSPALKTRLCQLWRRSNWYHSWAILLRCPGWAAREFEQEALCGTTTAVVRIDCAFLEFVSFGGNGQNKVGTVYDSTRWLQTDQSRVPPDVCAPRRVRRLGAFGTTVGVNSLMIGHWLTEALPRLLALHDAMPPGVPALVVDSPHARRYLAALFDSGVLPRSRVWFATPASLEGTVLHGENVYAVVHSHFSYVTAGDATARRVRDAFAWRPSRPRWNDGAPPHVLVVDRGSWPAARSFANHAAVLTTLQAAVQATAGLSLPTLSWKPSTAKRLPVVADIAVWRAAELIVMPHGAGGANILFARPGTPVIEVCYDNHPNVAGATFVKLFECPDTMAMLALNLGLPFYHVTGRGTIASPTLADLDQLRDAARQALAKVSVQRHQRQQPTNGSEALPSRASGCVASPHAVPTATHARGGSSS